MKPKNEPQVDEKTVAAILNQVPPRPLAPEHHKQAVFDAVYDVWDRKTKRRTYLRNMTWFSGLAAALLLTVFYMGKSPVIETEPVAWVDDGRIAITGTSTLVTKDLGGQLFSTNQMTAVDQGALLRLTDGSLLKIGENSEFTFHGRHTIELHQGLLYFDSNGAPNAKILVSTSFGGFSNLGTQFAVETKPDAVIVSVRSGRVQVQNVPAAEQIVAGQRLTIDQTDGVTGLMDFPVYGEYWAWTEDLVTVFDMEGKPIIAFLRWISRETGRAIQFEDSLAKAEAMQETLGPGLVTEATLEQLEWTLRATTLESRIIDGTILVRLKSQ